MNHFQNVRTSRKAYTLVEILVALGIILSVMGLVATYYPNYSEREQHNRAADIIKNTLMRARQWAIRDKTSTGISFVAPGPGEFEAKIQFYQNAPILYGNVGNFTFTGTAGGTSITLNPPAMAGKVLLGDYFIEDGATQPAPHQVIANGDATTGIVSLNSGLSISSTASYKFRLVRGPRPMESEPAVLLPRNISIEVRDSSNTVVSTAPQIMFNARGQIEPFATGKFSIIVILSETDGTTEVDRILLTIDAINGITRGK